MNQLRDYLNELEVEVVSETGAARVTISKARSVEIDLDAQCPSYINEKELAEDIENAVKEARKVHSTGIREFKEDIRTNSSHKDRVQPLSATQQERHERYIEEIALIECTTKSKRGMATVTVYGDGDIIIRITPHTLTRVGFDMNGLGREIASTIEAGIKERSKRIKMTHRKVFGQI